MEQLTAVPFFALAASIHVITCSLCSVQFWQRYDIIKLKAYCSYFLNDLQKICPNKQILLLHRKVCVKGDRSSMGFAYLSIRITCFRPTIYRYFIRDCSECHWGRQTWFAAGLNAPLAWLCRTVLCQQSLRPYANHAPSLTLRMSREASKSNIPKLGHPYIPMSIEVPKLTHSHISMFSHLHSHIFTPSHLPTFTHSHNHTFTHSHIHRFAHTHLHTCTHSLIHTFTHLHIPSSHIHIHIVTYSNILIFAYSHVHNFTHSHLHIHTFRQSDIHTSTCSTIYTISHSHIPIFARFLNSYVICYARRTILKSLRPQVRVYRVQCRARNNEHKDYVAL